MITYSEDFSDSSWSKNGGATVENSYSSPDGGSNAYKINLINSSSQVGATAIGLDTSKEYTFSVWLRTESGTLNVDLGNVQSGVYETVNVTDEWVRYKITQTPSATTRYPNIDYNQSGSVLAWGAQLEQQSYATSYIPTNGAANTRLQDIANNSGNSTLINSTEGVLYCEIAALANDGGAKRQISINNETTTDRVQISYENVTNQISIFYKAQNGATQFTMTETLTDATQFNKIAFKWKANDFALWVNGTETDTISSGVTSNANALTKIDFDQFNQAAKFFGKVKALAVYKEALTDAELQSLTTI